MAFNVEFKPSESIYYEETAYLDINFAVFFYKNISVLVIDVKNAIVRYPLQPTVSYRGD